MSVRTQQLSTCVYVTDDVRLGVFDLVVERVGVDAEGLVHYALGGAEPQVSYSQASVTSITPKDAERFGDDPDLNLDSGAGSSSLFD